MRLRRRRPTIDYGERIWQFYLGQEGMIQSHRRAVEQIMKMVLK